MEELDLLKAEIESLDSILEGNIVESEEEEKNLTELTKELDAIRRAAQKVNDQINAKKQHLNLLRRDRENAQKEKNLREMRIRVEQDRITASEGIKASIKERRHYALSKAFKWTEAAFEHQWQGALTLAHFGNGMLADEMGLGKTLTSIAYLDLLKFSRPTGIEYGAKRVLVIVPNDMVTEYAKELYQWAPHRGVLPAAGPNPYYRKLVNELSSTVGNVTVVTNYESMWREHEWLSTIDWDVVVVDEFHNAKDASGATFRALKELNATFWIPMTATFILNSPEDIFPALNLILPDVFDDISTFRRTYLIMGYDGKWKFQPGGEANLIKNVGARLVKRSIADVEITLPNKIESEVVIPRSAISQEQIEAMNEIDNALIHAGDEEYPISAAIAQITRKRQAAVYPAGIEIRQTQADYDVQEMMGEKPLPVGTVLAKISDDVPSIKIDWAVARLKKVIASGKRAVVFSQFKTALEALDDRLKAEGIRSVRYDGDTSKEVRNMIKKDFKRTNDEKDNEPSRWDVVLCNYKTGGVGLTLTRATYMLKLDDEWNPGKADQSTRRIWRIGQTEPVLIETLRIGDDKPNRIASIDFWMRDLIQIKQAIVDGVEQEVSIMESYRSYFEEEKAIKPTPDVSDIDNLMGELEGLL